MNKGVIAIMGLLLTGFIGSDCMAMGGGRSGGFVAVGSDRKYVTSGTLTSVTGLNGGKKDNQVAADGTPKPEMPPTVDIAALDSSKFDGASEGLDLSTEQKEKVAAAKAAVNAKREKYVKAQTDARTGYDKANDRAAIQAAAQEVVAAAREARNYDPNIDFAAELRRILSTEQFGKFREILTKG
ncbi:MAG: hypothetical protein M5U26_29345 [Planctomycetota bacterium]|nr:hypothetical protein [Planctomycetota bacterium]